MPKLLAERGARLDLQVPLTEREAKGRGAKGRLYWATRPTYMGPKAYHHLGESTGVAAWLQKAQLLVEVDGPYGLVGLFGQLPDAEGCGGIAHGLFLTLTLTFT